jgi:hypothetical protein
MSKRSLLSASLLTACFTFAAAEEPLFRVGLVTDTHWTENTKSFDRTEAALKVFKREKVDVVANLGDIADKHYPAAYRYYREKLFPSVFPENPPLEIFVYANHDALGRKGEGGAVRSEIPGYFAAMRRELGIKHAPDDRVVFKGYPFVIFQQFVPQETMEKMLEATAREFPEGPIFVLDHVPAPKEKSEKNNKRRVVFGKYPRVVHLYGHVHMSLRDENPIWQGSHTEVGAGCLQNWRGHLVGTAPASKDCFEFSIMDVYRDKLVFRRFSAEDGKEFKAPWVVPLPFDPATAPYAPARRAAATPAPEFAAGAKLALKTNKPFSALFVDWPEAGQGGEVCKYYVKVAVKEADGKFREFARKDSYSEFYLAENKRKGKHRQRISNGYFEPGREYRVSVTPVGFFGREGSPIEAEFTSPSDVREAVTVFESRDPMKELVFASGLTGGEPLPLRGGFWRHRGGNARLVIPPECWAGARGTRFRFTVDMDVRQSEGHAWTMVLRNPKPLHNANNRIIVEGGKADGRRYVIEFSKRSAKYFYELLIREGAPGSIRFNYVRIEKLK